MHVVSTKFCNLYVEMVQSRQILIANDCGYKILRFSANPRKYQTLVPAKNSHLKVIKSIANLIFLPFLPIVSPAIITTHPFDQTVSEGGSVTFSVNALGDGLTYQWQRNGANVPGNNSNFEGVSTAVLKIKVVEVDDAGMYRCIVFNGAGDNVISNEVTLIVSK